MATQLLSVDELLKSQATNSIKAVITSDPDSDKNVIIKPYTGSDVGNSQGISITKESIQGVQESGDECSCSNPKDNVVTVFFKDDAAIPLRTFVDYIKGLRSQGTFPRYLEGTTFPLEKAGDSMKLPCNEAESHGPITVYRDPFGRICGIKVYNYKIPING